jgi:GNAT superfamily N-acetyltransferase
MSLNTSTAADDSGHESSVHELNDGTRVLVRPLRPNDRGELARGYAALSEEARRTRFFSAPPELSEADLDYLTKLDLYDHFAWAAFALDDPGTPGVGVARYVRDQERDDVAEAAVTVLDSYQQRGLGTLLLLLLAERAQQNGITTFVSYVLWDNKALLDGLAAAGARIEPAEAGVARVEVDLPDPDTGGIKDAVRSALHALAETARMAFGSGSSGPRLEAPHLPHAHFGIGDRAAEG